MVDEVLSQADGDPEDVGVIPAKPFELTDTVIDAMFNDNESAPAMGSTPAYEAIKEAEKGKGPAPEPEGDEPLTEAEQKELLEAEGGGEHKESQFQKRIRKLSEKLEREIEARYDAKLNDALAKIEAATPKPATEAGKSVEDAIKAEVARAFPEPEMDSFDDIKSWMRAWGACERNRLAYEEAVRTNLKQREELAVTEQRKRREWESSVDAKDREAAEKYDGFKQVAFGVGKLIAETAAGRNESERMAVINSAIYRLQSLDNYADVVVYLGQHPDEVKTIIGQPDAEERAFEIKSLSKRLKSETFNPKGKEIKPTAPLVEAPGSGGRSASNFQKALAAAKAAKDGETALDLIASQW